MTNINVTNFRKNIYAQLENTIKFNEIVNISTKEGNAVLMSEEDYNNIMATLAVYNNPYMYKKLQEGLNTPIDECLVENEVDW